MLPIVRTPLKTRLLKGQETKFSFGSSRTTSIEGSLSRTYLAAEAPPQPPPMTTTRRPLLGATSPVIVAGAAQPAASRPEPVPEVRRKSLRVTLTMSPLRVWRGGIVFDFPSTCRVVSAVRYSARVNLAALGDENVRQYGEYASLAFEGCLLTNVDQQRSAGRVANALGRRGVAPGDRVVVMLPNCPEVLQSYAAILRLGAVVVPVVFLLGPAEVRHILEHSGARTLPLSHSYGLTLMNAGNILGTRAVLLRWFNPELVLETIQRYRVQQMAGVPTMFVYLLKFAEADRFDTSSMKLWGSGAAPLPVEIVAPFEARFGGRLLEGYGLTEAAPVVSAHRFSGERRLGSVGQPIPGVEVAIFVIHHHP